MHRATSLKNFYPTFFLSGGAATVLASIACTQPTHLNWFSAIARTVIWLLPVFWSVALFLIGAEYFLRRHKDWVKKFYWQMTGFSLFFGAILASLLVPSNAFAQVVSGGAGGGNKCSSLGFLQALGTLTTNTFSNLATGASASGSTADLPSQGCQFILMLLWVLVFGSFAALIQVGFQLYQRGGGGWGEAGHALIVPVFLVVCCLSMLNMFGLA